MTRTQQKRLSRLVDYVERYLTATGSRPENASEDWAIRFIADTTHKALMEFKERKNWGLFRIHSDDLKHIETLRWNQEEIAMLKEKTK